MVLFNRPRVIPKLSVATASLSCTVSEILPLLLLNATARDIEKFYGQNLGMICGLLMEKGSGEEG